MDMSKLSWIKKTYLPPLWKIGWWYLGAVSFTQDTICENLKENIVKSNVRHTCVSIKHWLEYSCQK